MGKILNKKKEKYSIKKVLRQAGMVFLSAFVLAFAVELFIANFGIVSGGVTGIAIVLEELCKNYVGA